VGISQYAYFSTVGFFFAPNFIQNLYTVLKKRLWESRSTPTLVVHAYSKGSCSSSVLEYTTSTRSRNPEI
jgi:hypothetical protein